MPHWPWCIWPDCLDEAQQDRLVRDLDHEMSGREGPRHVVADTRDICGCREPDDS